MRDVRVFDSFEVEGEARSLKRNERQAEKLDERQVDKGVPCRSGITKDREGALDVRASDRTQDCEVTILSLQIVLRG